MARLREASVSGDLDAVRALFAEYARSVDEPCCFAGFERELADLPRGYLVLFLSYEEAVPAGCVGLREVDRGTAEMKRLYVRSVSYTHLRAHETPEHLVCRLLLEK